MEITLILTRKFSCILTAVERQKLEQQNTEDQLRKGVKASYKHLQEDLEKIEIAKMNIDQAQESYRIVNQTYFNQLPYLPIF